MHHFLHKERNERQKKRRRAKEAHDVFRFLKSFVSEAKYCNGKKGARPEQSADDNVADVKSKVEKACEKVGENRDFGPEITQGDQGNQKIKDAEPINKFLRGTPDHADLQNNLRHFSAQKPSVTGLGLNLRSIAALLKTT